MQQELKEVTHQVTQLEHAIPAWSSVEAPNHVLSVFLPVQVRGQVAVPNQSASFQGSQTAVGNGAQRNSSINV